MKATTGLIKIEIKDGKVRLRACVPPSGVCASAEFEAKTEGNVNMSIQNVPMIMDLGTEPKQEKPPQPAVEEKPQIAVPPPEEEAKPRIRTRGSKS